MSSTIRVAMGEVVASEDERMELASFVGSCVAVCLYDPDAKIAGMAHVMLPKRTDERHPARSPSPGRYADQAVENLVKLMVGKGAETRRLVAKLVGGAKIFTHEGGNGVFDGSLAV